MFISFPEIYYFICIRCVLFLKLLYVILHFYFQFVTDNFERLLTDMGYLVTQRDNIKHWEMAWELKCMAEMEHKKYDSFICVISSHGNLNQVFGCDRLKMTLSKEIRQFRSEKCSSLAGKPKLFFLQSCQTDLEG